MVASLAASMVACWADLLEDLLVVAKVDVMEASKVEMTGAMETMMAV